MEEEAMYFKREIGQTLLRGRGGETIRTERRKQTYKGKNKVEEADQKEEDARGFQVYKCNVDQEISNQNQEKNEDKEE